MPKEHQIQVLLAFSKRTGKRNELGLIVAPLYCTDRPFSSITTTMLLWLSEREYAFLSIDVDCYIELLACNYRRFDAITRNFIQHL